MSTTLKEKHHKKVAPQVGYLNHPEALDNIPETVVEDID